MLMLDYGRAQTPLTLRPVTPIRRRLRLFTWIALFAMLGLAIAPSVSHALSAQQASNPWTEICSAPGSGEQQPRSAAMHLEHCAMCCVAASAMGLPPAPVAVLPSPGGAGLVAALFLEASHPLHAWRPPQARAPPSFS
jgi:Protein of unknown function (DUF2946)